MITTITLTINHKKPIIDLLDKVAGRAFTLDGVDDVSATTDAGWRSIDSAPKDGRTMFVVCGFNVTNENVGARKYTTDPYCVWPGDDGGWVRWPHTFPPTHWMPLHHDPYR